MSELGLIGVGGSWLACLGRRKEKPLELAFSEAGSVGGFAQFYQPVAGELRTLQVRAPTPTAPSCTSPLPILPPPQRSQRGAHGRQSRSAC